MPFWVIKGTYVTEGKAPDGDTVTFKPDKPSLLKKLENNAALLRKLDEKGVVNLRFEGIDTPETHYPSPAKGGHQTHQPDAPANAATDFTLKSLGFTNVVWGSNDEGRRTKVKSASGSGRGYILSNASDGRNGRAVSFVYAGNPPQDDGDAVYLSASDVKSSVNYKALEAGVSYPTYYNSLYSDLRKEMSKAVAAARAANRGIWKIDRTTAGFQYGGLDTIQKTHMILPKFFRRLVEYGFLGHAGGSGFKGWLQDKDDFLITTDQLHERELADLVQFSGGKLSLDTKPEDIIFRPKG
jgi:endonuclease YncB( thermonuclease family)